MTAPQLLDVAAAAERHRTATATARAHPDVLRVSCFTSTRAEDRTRPYHVTVKVGSIVRLHRFPDEAQRDRYAATARADLALLADRIEGKDR